MEKSERNIGFTAKKARNVIKNVKSLFSIENSQLKGFLNRLIQFL